MPLNNVIIDYSSNNWILSLHYHSFFLCWFLFIENLANTHLKFSSIFTFYNIVQNDLCYFALER